MNDGMMEPAMA